VVGPFFQVHLSAAPIVGIANREVWIDITDPTQKLTALLKLANRPGVDEFLRRTRVCQSPKQTSARQTVQKRTRNVRSLAHPIPSKVWTIYSNLHGIRCNYHPTKGVDR
jgi:hypothetical protein